VSGEKSNTAIATTDTANSIPLPYVGRFAPSPTGLMHLGSLYTAVASYLDARANQGRWIVRIEDLDRPREVDGAAREILRNLEDFGFEWDGPVARQSTRSDFYLEALRMLRDRRLSFDCSCTREALAGQSRYPGYCRDRPQQPGPTGVRLIVAPHTIHFLDRIQGPIYQDVAATSGDLLIRRRDQLISYLLAVVVDDAEQGITHVVRGADLIDETPKQIYLQQQLQLATPQYAHVPTLVEDGLKLAKSRRSLSLCSSEVGEQLIGVFQMLGLKPPQPLNLGTISEIWRWAIGQWHVERVPKQLNMRAPGLKINKYL